MELTRQTDQPLYLQVADQLRAKIEQGEFAPHTRLPATRTLADRLGVNRITIINAYAELEAEGLVVSRVGSGTYVAARPAPVDSPTPWQPLRWPNQMMAEMMRMAHQPGVISFAGGAPPSEFLPVNQFRRALNDVLRRDGPAALQYEATSGYLPLRRLIAEHLQQQQNIQAQPDNILITTGCQQALDMALRVLTTRTDSVLLVEDPCYLGLLDIAASRRITPMGVPMDEDGLHIPALENLARRYHPQLIYITPSFQNPTGRTMPLARRQALLEVAARYNISILEDASYDQLRYEGSPQPSLKSLDSGNVVLYAGGYSKTLAPGLRIGYLVTPPHLYTRLVAAKQTADILTSPLNQRALHAYLSGGEFDRHLRQVRPAYRQRRETMLAALDRYLPAEAQWQSPQGGMYIWVELPPTGPAAIDLYLAAINAQVAFSVGSFFSAGGAFPYAMRLNFVVHSPEKIEEGIRRLGLAWQAVVGQPRAMPQAGAHIL